MGWGTVLGDSLILLLVAFVRELFGSGKLYGVTVLPLTTEGGWFEANGLLCCRRALFPDWPAIWALRTWKPEQVGKGAKREWASNTI
ncbi:MAG: hypothetical protein Ct9H300mP1_33770 [Planctomycetaceae bacterium]|nr:MAG: hypothetical protein Ct9H300mP1_33770 [Planctomycetaceae bacterium]